MADRPLPVLECDIVMTGGITSGIVYPKALLQLKDKFRFRNIGGASAGAIAAAPGLRSARSMIRLIGVGSPCIVGFFKRSRPVLIGTGRCDQACRMVL